MADETETEGCWLANAISEERPVEVDDFLEKDESKHGKSLQRKVLPCHEELFREHSELQEKIKAALMLLNEKEEQLEVKKQGVEEEMEQYNKEKSVLEEKLKQQEERLSEMNNKISTEQAAVAKLEESCEKDRHETSTIENQVIEFEKNMNTRSKEVAKQPPCKVSLLLRQIDCLSGMTVNFVESNVVSVSITGRQAFGCTSNNIEVLLSFRENELRNLASVEVKSDVCSWNDIIDTALHSGGDAVWLLGEVQRRFQTVYGLQDEIQTLQQRYAIDWQPEERLIAVIIPGKRQTTCKLQLHSDYPSNHTVECIHADDPLKEKVAIIEIKVKKNEISGLTQWLEHLHETDPV